MAITPEKAGRVTQDEIKAIEGAEREVDKILQKDFQGSGRVRVTGPLGKMTKRCLDELLRRFRNVGWQIEKKHESGDQRDPRGCPSYDYWVFKAAPPVRNSGFAEQINNPAPPPWRDDGPVNPNWR